LILVSLGTHEQPFPRAIDLVAPLAKPGRELVIQHGHTPPRPELEHIVWREFMPYEDVVALMKEAESVVCHAGVGTIITAGKTGHVPVVIPRRPELGEHVDHHQFDIAMKFGERGLLRCVSDETDLEPMLTPRRDGVDPFGGGSHALRDVVLRAVGGAD
jgi:UDP-N-acetylglucosamine transferase subunit ALG13